MIERWFDPKNLPRMFEDAFESIWTQNKDAPKLMTAWMRVAMGSSAFREVALTATNVIKSAPSTSVTRSGGDRVDDAFLRGAALGLMVGYRIREMQEEERA